MWCHKIFDDDEIVMIRANANFISFLSPHFLLVQIGVAIPFIILFYTSFSFHLERPRRSVCPASLLNAGTRLLLLLYCLNF